MNKQDITRMAREADREWDCDRDMVEWLEWFAALVAAAEREEIIKMAKDLYFWDDSERLIKAIQERNQQ